MSRRKRQILCRSAAVLSLLLWLALPVAEAWEPFHAWLHGGSIPDGDNSPVAALQQGKVATAALAVIPVVSLASVAVVRVASFDPFVGSPKSQQKPT